MTLKIFTDGGSKGNPGPAAIGIAFFKDGEIVETYRKDIGRATNNEAEYDAVITALTLCKDRLKAWGNVERIDLYSDSQLLVHQLNGLYKVKKNHIRVRITKIRILEAELKVPVYYHHIPREQNTIADALVNDTYFSQAPERIQRGL